MRGSGSKMSTGIRQQLGKFRVRGQTLLDEYKAITPKWNNDSKTTALDTLSTLDTHLARMYEKFQQWQTLVDDIEEDDDREAEQDVLDEWRNKEEYEYLMEDLANAVATLKKFKTARDYPKQPTEALVPAKIVIQSIEKFNGEYMKWKPFWQRYVLNIDSKDYAAIEKLDCLIGLLEGKALDEVRGYAIMEENYATVKQALLDRFGNTDRILYELQNQLYAVHPAQPNATSLRKTVTSINNLCLQIQNLGIDINTPTMKWDIIRKMPPAEQTELTITVQTQPQTTTADVLKKMKEYELKAEIRANIQHGTGSSYSTTSNQSSATFGPANKGVCSFCNGDHFSGSCETYKTIDERFDQLRSQQRCFKCAGRYHSSKECRSTVTCQHCNGRHRSFLCDKNRRMNYMIIM
uniref:Gag protein n=1 Tax=Panagrolaimus sp. PS1159 TaxID=55785 RepID=A0AC35GTR6_9BILA